MSDIQENKYKVLFFDLNETLLDLQEVKKSVANILDGGDATVALWFNTMLHYSLVTNAVDEFQKFGDIGAASLVMIANSKNISMSMKDAKKVLAPIRSAPPHADVLNSLQKLDEKGYRMVVLTNSSQTGMETQLHNAGIIHFFERAFSVDEIGIYKPDRHVYRWAAQKMGVLPEECLFIAAHSWDVTGAQSAGMDTAFLSRPGQSLFPLASKPTFTDADLEKLCYRL